MSVHRSSYLWRPARRAALLNPAGPETVASRLRRVTGVDRSRCPVGRQGRLRHVLAGGPGRLPISGLGSDRLPGLWSTVHSLRPPAQLQFP